MIYYDNRFSTFNGTVYGGLKAKEYIGDMKGYVKIQVNNFARISNRNIVFARYPQYAVYFGPSEWRLHPYFDSSKRTIVCDGFLYELPDHQDPEVITNAVDYLGNTYPPKVICMDFTHFFLLSDVLTEDLIDDYWEAYSKGTVFEFTPHALPYETQVKSVDEVPILGFNSIVFYYGVDLIPLRKTFMIYPSGSFDVFSLKINTNGDISGLPTFFLCNYGLVKYTTAYEVVNTVRHLDSNYYASEPVASEVQDLFGLSLAEDYNYVVLSEPDNRVGAFTNGVKISCRFRGNNYGQFAMKSIRDGIFAQSVLDYSKFSTGRGEPNLNTEFTLRYKDSDNNLVDYTFDNTVTRFLFYHYDHFDGSLSIVHADKSLPTLEDDLYVNKLDLRGVRSPFENELIDLTQQKR